MQLTLYLILLLEVISKQVVAWLIGHKTHWRSTISYKNLDPFWDCSQLRSRKNYLYIDSKIKNNYLSHSISHIRMTQIKKETDAVKSPINYCSPEAWHLESEIQDARKQAILERLRRGLVCLSYHILTKPASGAGFWNIIQEVIQFHIHRISHPCQYLIYIIHLFFFCF